MNIIIPAAGNSQRFNMEGMNTPKCFLILNHKMMIEHVIDMFDDEDKIHIIFNKEQFVHTKFSVKYSFSNPGLSSF